MKRMNGMNEVHEMKDMHQWINEWHEVKLAEWIEDSDGSMTWSEGMIEWNQWLKWRNGKGMNWMSEMNVMEWNGMKAMKWLNERMNEWNERKWMNWNETNEMKWMNDMNERS